MTLVWKLLRQHISLAQLAGFFFANLLGMLVVILGIQFYNDITPVFTQGDSFIKKDFIIISKHIGGVNALSGGSATFSASEMEDIQNQPFTRTVGQFTSSQFKVRANMGIDGASPMSTDLFFESVPDAFIDASLADWHFHPGDTELPIILPRSYLTIYNFGFAQSHGLPKLSEGMSSLIGMHIIIFGPGRQAQFTGRVVGFSNRLNTILVPMDFMSWANDNFSPIGCGEPERLIVEVTNPADERIANYLQKQGYEAEDDKLDAGKTTYFLKMVTTIVMSVGLLISALSFYILMLSIYLLVQKNTTKLQNLLLIGYSPWRVALPYQLLTVGLNLAVCLLALLLLMGLRHTYMNLICDIYPQMPESSLWPACLVSGLLLLLVSSINIIVIRRKILNIL